jgi:hypothetical protein
LIIAEGTAEILFKLNLEGFGFVREKLSQREMSLGEWRGVRQNFSSESLGTYKFHIGHGGYGAVFHKGSKGVCDPYFIGFKGVVAQFHGGFRVV